MPGNILNYRSVASKDGFGIQNLPLLWPRSNIPQADCLREQEKKKKKCFLFTTTKLEKKKVKKTYMAINFTPVSEMTWTLATEI